MAIEAEPPLSVADSDVVPIVYRSETWSTFRLEDGTVIRMRPHVETFRRWRKQFDLQGNPVYSHEMTWVCEVDALPEQRKKR